MFGILAYGAYLPHHRLPLNRIRDALGVGPATGERAIAAYDEDSTTMGVEAARTAVPPGLRSSIDRLLFATASPAYVEKTNATAIHAALGLDSTTLAFDLTGAVRSGVGALALAAGNRSGTNLVVLSDVRSGLPGGADDTQGGDGASALVLGEEHPDWPVLAAYVGQADVTDEFLDRWRLPQDRSARLWEERFGQEVYLPLAEESFERALAGAGVSAADVDQLVVAGVHERAVRTFATRSRVPVGTVAPRLTDRIGNAGTAQAGILLAATLDRAAPGELIALVVLADGASTFLFRATDALPAGRSSRSVASQLDGGDNSLTYPTYLSWRGLLEREPPRRPDPEPSYAPPAHRRVTWKFGLTGSRCQACGSRQLPPGRVCLRCHETDRMTPEPMADVPAVVRTFSVDRLAYSPSPPMIIAFVDFAGGGRFRFQVTDSGPDDIAVGTQVRPTFRRMSTARGIHNYFWKVRPARSGEEN